MNGFIRYTLSGLCLAGGLVAVTGCMGYRDCIDPCYPERYNYQARQEVRQAFASQMYNGHTLDQTVWNYHFEAATDKLTPGGQQFLAYVARRRPGPDSKVFLQTAEDVAYDPAAPDKTVDARVALDSRRADAVKRYLASQTPSVPYDVVVHNPHEVGMAAVPMLNTVTRNYLSSQGSIGAGSVTVGGGGAPGTAGGSSGGGAPTGGR